MTFNKLYIFSPSEKKAKVVEFTNGKNIITSSGIDGNDRGKSVIMKSLYHTLGADCFFDEKWKEQTKVYIVNISVNKTEYYIYRFENLFKVFNKEKSLLFKTVERKDLAVYFADIFNFSIELPDRSEEKLEMTPPVYNFLLYFLDQDKLDGPKFLSFNSLGQYKDYKLNLLYCHFGVFNKEYFEIKRKLEELNDTLAMHKKEKKLAEEMLEKVQGNIGGAVYSKNIEALRFDVERSKNEYSEIAKKLSKIRNNLISLRNEKDELERNLSSLNMLNKDNEKQLKSLHTQTCSLCKSKIEDTLELKISKYSFSDDIILFSNELQTSITSIDNKISKEEEIYKAWLLKMEKYEESLSDKTLEVNDILKHKGFIEIRDSLTNELSTLELLIKQNNIDIDEYKKKEKQYEDEKKKINAEYYELMLNDKMKFGLEELKAEKFKNINYTFPARGSNKPIVTLIWYINLIKVKNKFNPDVIHFPVVFDSPNNAETDDDKKIELYKYIVDSIDEKNQLIVSGIGYTSDSFDGLKFDTVIHLENDKYKVLCEEEYQENIELLKKLSISDNLSR